MTLNLTAVTPRCIYQSADFRLLDWTTGKVTDFGTQKIAIVNRARWHASVCFAGVGRTPKVNVGDWVAERIASIQYHDPFQRFLEELLTANDWLVDVPAPYKKHSFSVGAFDGTEPVFALVSNFESISASPAENATSYLSISRIRPTEAKTFVAGQIHAVSRQQRKSLAILAAQDPEPQRMYQALADLNRSVAAHNRLVSPACFTTHIRITGDGGGAAHGIDNTPFMPLFAMPPEIRETVGELLDKQFGPGRAQLRQLAFARSEPTDEFHKTQLREKPDDPSVHSNYGAFLKDHKNDAEGAEREYRKALGIDNTHVDALGNLALLMWDKGNKNQASTLFRQALAKQPPNENVTYNFARFLWREQNDVTGALAVLNAGIVAHPESGRLRLLDGEINLGAGNARAALESFYHARDKRADQGTVELYIAYALHMSGAPIGECIGAYRIALTLNPGVAPLRLNLCQLLFLKGDRIEANKQLREAIRLGLDDASQLEALFYELAHTDSDPAVILAAIEQCLSRGARLSWNVQANIEFARNTSPQKASLLETVRQVMTDGQDLSILAKIPSQWEHIRRN